jgi:hypothetical protein
MFDSLLADLQTDSTYGRYCPEVVLVCASL